MSTAIGVGGRTNQRGNRTPIEEPALCLRLVLNDPPVHTRLRKLLNKGFTPRAISEAAARSIAKINAYFAAIPTTR